ncbi:MAG: urease accessory protein UreE [Alphaproteobacteria bacterium]
MLRALETVERGSFDPGEVVDSVTLDLEARRKRRHTLEGVGGTHFLVDLPTVPSLKHGDGFRLESRAVIEISAACEALMEVRSSVSGDMARIAWHLGNRHLPVQFVDGGIRLRADHVIEAMLQKLGAEVRHVTFPFDPEGGAYGHGHTHGHSHHHD